MGPLALVMAGAARFVAAGRVDAERVSVRRFPNGELVAAVPARVAGRRCAIVGSVSPPPGNVERVTLVAHAARRAGAAHITAVLPYLAYARQDRADPGQSLGLAWLGELLRAAGVDDVVCVDVHSEMAADVMGLPVTSLSPAPVLAGALPPAWCESATFVAPDEGAIERCTALAQAAGSAAPIAWLRKRRTPAGVRHLRLVGTPARRAVIVDDILDTGGTLVSCCRELRAAGVEEVAVVVTHGQFTGDAWRAMFGLGVRRLWLTDTVLVRRRPAEAAVVAVAPLLSPALAGAPAGAAAGP